MKFNTQKSQFTALVISTLFIACAGLSFNTFAFIDNHDGCDDPNETYMDPLIIDLGQDGIHLGQAGVGVWFDLMANGQPVYMQWTAPGGNEAFVILDKNRNGLADNGSEMFTNFNPLHLENRVSPNGFVDFAQYDQLALGGDNDGFISPADDIWGQLLLWTDNNADGISTPDEMKAPEDVGLTRFYTIPRNNDRMDDAGNWLPLWSWAMNDKKSGRRNYRLVDVFFKKL